MPDVRGETLQRAINSVLSVTGDIDLDLEVRNRKDVRQVINYTNWEVCAQAPRGVRAQSSTCSSLDKTGVRSSSR